VSGLYFNGEVAVTIEQSWLDLSTTYPLGGMIVRLSNTACYAARITISLDNGHHYVADLAAGEANERRVIPERVPLNHLLHVTVEINNGY
jgi:hypothetical protein